ncbi:kinase [Nocardiopsis alba]|uniref:kinase n=1 Tax=Nocardiopsis alba TaxID=53437 RepID=UPI003649686E
MVGPFRLVGRLGEDSCSRMYVASSEEHPSVALRIIKASHSANPAFRTVLGYRVENAQHVLSPYVAGLLDFDLERTTPWVATEYHQGIPLRSLVETHGPLPAEALRPLALALAQGLADLHAGHRTHAALSPDTILITRRGALLSDIGFEWAAAEIGPLSNQDFAAPEGRAAPAVDVYAWAAVLVWAVGGKSVAEGIDRLPLQLRGLAEACLREDPALRPTSGDLVRLLGGPATPDPWPSDLVGLLDRQAAQVTQALATASPRRNRGKGVLLASGSAGLALILVAAGVLLWPFSEEEPVSSEEDTTPALITDAGCLDDPGFPPPDKPIDDLDAEHLSFSPDGDLLAVSSYNHGLTLWDWRAGEEIARPLEEVSQGAFTFAPVGCQLVVATFDQFPQSDFRYTVATTVDIPSGEVRDYLGPQSERALNGLEEPRRVYSFDYSPSGERAIINLELGSSWGESLPRTGVIDLETGEMTNVWDPEELDDFIYARYLDEERLITIANRTLDVRATDTGQRQQTVRNLDSQMIALIKETEEIVYVSPDRVLRWDLENDSESGSFPVPDYADVEEHTDHAVSNLRVDTELGLLHFSYTIGPTPSGGGEPPPPGSDRRFPNRGHLWDLETGEEIGDEDITSRPMDFHPDGEAIASIGPEGDVRILDPETFEVIDTLS